MNLQKFIIGNVHVGKTLHDNPVHFRQQRAGMKTSKI